MRLGSILGLPASIILLINSHTTSADPINGGRSPALRLDEVRDDGGVEHDVLRRRAVEEHLRMGRSPVGVRKMPADEGQKFYMEYWQFDEDSTQSTLQSIRPRDDEARLLSNGSIAIPFRAPFALHTIYGSGVAARAAEVLAILEKREFICPTGYAACSGIKHPNSCCATDENCFPIQETGPRPGRLLSEGTDMWRNYFEL